MGKVLCVGLFLRLSNSPELEECLRTGYQEESIEYIICVMSRISLALGNVL